MRWLFCLIPALALAGCEKDEDGDDEAADGESDGDDDGADDAPADEGGDDAPADEGGDDAPADEGGDDAPADEGGDDAPADDGGMTCEGGWYLGSVPFSGDGILEPCDANPPMNCADGHYIVFDDTSECICLPECSSFGLGLGESCTTNSDAVVCTAIANDDGTSSGNFCVPVEWNLCG